MPMETALRVLEEACRLREEGRFHAAADRLLEAFRRAPDSPDVCLLLGQVLEAAGDPDDARSFLRRARAGAVRDPSGPLPVPGAAGETKAMAPDGLEGRLDPRNLVGWLLDDKEDTAA